MTDKNEFTEVISVCKNGGKWNCSFFQGALEDFDDLVFACGSGGTAAGLSIANYLTGSKLRLVIIRDWFW